MYLAWLQCCRLRYITFPPTKSHIVQQNNGDNMCNTPGIRTTVYAAEKQKRSYSCYGYKYTLRR